MVNKRNMAICAAAQETGILEQDMRNTLVSHQDGLINISFTTEWMMYECYVDEESLEVLGFDYRPLPVNMLLAELPESGQDAS